MEQKDNSCEGRAALVLNRYVQRRAGAAQIGHAPGTKPSGTRPLEAVPGAPLLEAGNSRSSESLVPCESGTMKAGPA
jgi:hypothetical protein